METKRKQENYNWGNSLKTSALDCPGYERVEEEKCADVEWVEEDCIEKECLGKECADEECNWWIVHWGIGLDGKIKK